MFSRRRASSNPPGIVRPTTPVAAAAASQAFLRNRASNASLSSAAAAAALRSHTSPSTPVGNLQTKRMVRRGSLSSIGSSSGDQTRPGLVRRSSSGSMTERTFRTPSPSPSSGGPTRRSNVPPVPALPRSIPPVPPKSIRRPSSADPVTKRVTAPASAGRDVRGNAGDRGSRIYGSPTAAAKGNAVLARVSETSIEGVNGNRSSVNYSRPISPPPPSSAPADTKSGFSRPTSLLSGQTVSFNALERSLDRTTPQAVQNAAEAALSRRQKTKASQPVENSRLAQGTLAQGTMAVRPAGSAVQDVNRMRPSSPTNLPNASGKPAVHTAVRAAFLAAGPNVLYSPTTATSPSTNGSPQTERSFMRAQEVLARRALDDLALEEDLERAERTTRLRSQINAANQANAQSRRADRLQPAPEFQDKQALSLTRSVSHQSSGRSKHENIGPVPPLPDRNRAGVPPRGTRMDRPQSLSPTRVTRFGATTTLGPISATHDPLPRAASPVKSAMKHSPSSSIRIESPATSPFSLMQSGIRKAPSEISDTASDDGHGLSARKKKARVSFDLEALKSAPSGSTLKHPASPYPLGMNSNSNDWRQTSIDEAEANDLAEILKPSPALPSFGSIRAQRKPDDEPDVSEKLTETITPSMTNSVSTIADPVGLSHDDAVGAVLSKEFASTKQGREETGSDGAAHHESQASTIVGDPSDVTGSFSEVEKASRAQLTVPGKHNIPAINVDAEMGNRSHLGAPQISVIPATPLPAEVSDPSFSQLAVAKYTESQTPASVGYLPEAAADEAPKSDSDDDGSVYDDASEDAAIADDPTFASLDAMVEKTLHTEPEAATAPSTTFPVEVPTTTAPSSVQPKETTDSTIMVSDKVRSALATPAAAHASQTGKPPIKSALRKSQPSPASTRTAAPVTPKARSAAIPKIASPTVPLRRKDSDTGSESSFRRSRPSSARPPKDGRFTMRQSMRGERLRSSGPARPSSPVAQRPVYESRSPSGMAAGRSMRATLRTREQPKSTKRSKGSKMPFRSSKAKGGPGGGGGGPRPFASRFADSSDEEDGAYPAFRSRFADSDDDDDDAPGTAANTYATGRGGPAARRRTGLTPVRGIPRRAGVNEGDSTDLEDSDEESRRAPVSGAATAAAATAAAAMTATLTATSAARGPHTAKAGARGAGHSLVSTTTTTVTGPNAALATGSLRPVKESGDHDPATVLGASPQRPGWRRSFSDFFRRRKAGGSVSDKASIRSANFGGSVAGSSHSRHWLHRPATPPPPVPPISLPPATGKMTDHATAGTDHATPRTDHASVGTDHATPRNDHATPGPASPLRSASPINPASPANPTSPTSPTSPASPASPVSPVNRSSPSGPASPQSASSRTSARHSVAGQAPPLPSTTAAWPLPGPDASQPLEQEPVEHPVEQSGEQSKTASETKAAAESARRKSSSDRPHTSDGASVKLPQSLRPSVGDRRFTSGGTSATKADKTVVLSERTGKKKKFPKLRRAFGLVD